MFVWLHVLQGKNVLAHVHPSLVSSEIVESWLLGGNWQDQIVEKIVSGAGGEVRPRFLTSDFVSRGAVENCRK